MPKITVGILTHNRSEQVLKAIASCYTQGIKDIEVVVVDADSRDGTYKSVGDKFPQVKLIRLPRNLGCPGGRNHVYANSSGDYIVNLDDDGFLGTGALQLLIKTFESDLSIGIVGMRQCYPEDPWSERTDNETMVETGHFRGGVSAFRRQMLEEIGFYPEDFFFSKEEEYMDLKALDAGYKIVFHPGIIMWHPRNRGMMSIDSVWEYYIYRNPLLVVIRLFPGWYLWKYLIARIFSYALISLRRKTVGKYLKAVLDALLSLPMTMLKRQPCSAEAVRKYFRLRGVGQKQ